jgi:hypothetical protein
MIFFLRSGTTFDLTASVFLPGLKQPFEVLGLAVRATVVARRRLRPSTFSSSDVFCTLCCASPSSVMEALSAPLWLFFSA